MATPAPILSMVEAFLDDIEGARLADVPALRAMLIATPADTGTLLAPLLLGAHARGPEMLASLPPDRLETLSLLGDLVERATDLEDRAILAGLRRFAAAMRAILPPPPRTRQPEPVLA